jgi:hypothetical protein
LATATVYVTGALWPSVRPKSNVAAADAAAEAASEPPATPRLCIASLTCGRQGSIQREYLYSGGVDVHPCLE